jgi:hypothetical protein
MKTRSWDSDDENDDWDESLKHGSQKRPLRHRFKNDTRGGHQRPALSKRSELFIPLSHFRINHKRVVSVSFTGFYTDEPITLYRVEIVPEVPSPSAWNSYFTIPKKLPTGQLVLRCSRPNSFAFGIDDGQPQYAREVMRILDAVATGLRDRTTNFTRFYGEMLKKGHQVALHSNTHPK